MNNPLNAISAFNDPMTPLADNLRRIAIITLQPTRQRARRQVRRRAKRNSPGMFRHGSGHRVAFMRFPRFQIGKPPTGAAGGECDRRREAGFGFDPAPRR